MPSRQCKECEVRWPMTYAECPICLAGTNYLAFQTPTADWEARIPDAPEDERLYRWRYDEMIRAGFWEAAALELSRRRDVDIELARRLARDAGPALAYEIVA